MRTDSRSQKLHSFFSSKEAIEISPICASTPIPSEKGPKKVQEVVESNPEAPENIELVQVELTSILELRKDIEDHENEIITETFREHSFVGCIDSRLALIQHHTRLLMVNFEMIR